MEAINDMRAKEAPERKQVESMQTEAINSVKEQLDKLLDMSTRGLIDEDQFVKKNKILLAELKQLHKKQKTQNKDTESWYEYMCRLVKSLSSCSEKFANGTIADRKEILTAIGQNPVLIYGKLQVTPDDWLIPQRNSTKEIREEVIKVRLMSEQIRNKLLEALRIRWCPQKDSNLQLLLRTEPFYPLNYGGMYALTLSLYTTLSKFIMNGRIFKNLFVHKPVLNFLLGFIHITRCVN